jgi:hypothetical protein
MKNPAGSKLGASPSLGLPGLAVDCLAPTLAPTWFPVVPTWLSPQTAHSTLNTRIYTISPRLAQNMVA